ncbi:spherulation-specific family 4 protein [Streptomyces goshikiensis]|uniref:spherulation-specific family 4 protein n=1 Tax=Streptomyces TaxID=1883 RepID=UPI0009395340|nr:MULTISPECIES: spherulation-specific family 4 protein [Streptomyces]OKI35364.1 phage tail protein [Streptomyces sp. CB03578]RPK46014.1 Spherulation-specific family 4 [Streptomyces sp. ADI91-18]WBY21959.1 phage tail protein [Streptomyces goshikiensis]WSS00742.1 spherulation-specific family 4 protein [Streptomyces goshikiensis]WSX98216.1 spherulation-specific family 4 protein [Streptomyces goshikiensis]
MPHLTTPPGARLPGARAGGMGFGIPGYAHPLLAPVEWAELTRPGTPLHWAVLNVTDGPGGRPDPHCTEAAARLREAGGTVLGHLAMRNGKRSFGELVSDAHRFRDWYRVGGFYLADAPADRGELEAVRRVVDTLRGLGDGLRIVLGHGTHPYAGYADAADQLVTFSGAWADYRWSQVAEWTSEHPPERFCHLVHGVPRTHLEEAVRIARWQGAGTVWFTDRRGAADRDPWASMPAYWDEIVSRIGLGVSE